jgi:acetyltransferase
VQSPDLPHKTEAGAVALDLRTPEAVRAGYLRVMEAAQRHAPEVRILGVLVQPMAQPGREVIVGIKRDATFGPMLMVGLGGVLTELLGDVALAPVPLAEREARDLIASLQGARLLEGYRGAPPADIDALVQLMVRLAQLATHHADAIAEIDLNPVIVHPHGQGLSVVDALIVKRTR